MGRWAMKPTPSAPASPVGVNASGVAGQASPSGPAPGVPMTESGSPIIPPLSPSKTSETRGGEPSSGADVQAERGSPPKPQSAMKLTEFLDLATLQDIQDSL